MSDNMRSLVKVLGTAFLLAVSGSWLFFTPLGQRLEETFGLSFLYTLRGPRESMADVVIVNVDDSSSRKLNLSAHFSKWPRSIHAALVDKLRKYGARVIAFDIHFVENKDSGQDRLFAEAIRRAGNVILVEQVQHSSLPIQASSNCASTVEIDTLIPPIQPLADVALGLAPFPLPKTPIGVNETWRFKPSCGNVPTLPVVVYQATLLSRYELFRTLLLEKVPQAERKLPATAQEIVESRSLVSTMREIREIFLQNHNLKEELLSSIDKTTDEELPAGIKLKLQSLIALYGGSSITGIDLYGPPTSQTTYSYYDILSSGNGSSDSFDNEIKDKVVFIGAAGKNWSNQKDGFYTVFSRSDGLDLSGVELAATVYANLVENRSVHQLPSGVVIALISISALLACLLSFFLTPPRAGFLLSVSILLYLGGAHLAFARYAIWAPLIVSLAILPVTAFAIANLSNYLTTFKERRNARTALGFYLPGNIASELAKDPSFLNKADRKVYGTCLITDAQQYTTLSERIAPEDLSLHMKRYYTCLIKEVNEGKGFVCNIIGDSMLALWPSSDQNDIDLRKNACQAALRIVDAVERFNRKYTAEQLPTRIGLHCGFLLLDNIGAENHYEYAPVGDIVNTVSRIEGLNKKLGTQILASQEVLHNIEGMYSREVGEFLLSGKTKPVTLYELVNTNIESDSWDRLYREAFPEALVCFRKGEWDNALAGFTACLTLKPGDGPSRFYLQLCRAYHVKPPPADWQGIVRIEKK